MLSEITEVDVHGIRTRCEQAKVMLLDVDATSACKFLAAAIILHMRFGVDLLPRDLHGLCATKWDSLQNNR